jgi:hypothetical protein
MLKLNLNYRLGRPKEKRDRHTKSSKVYFPLRHHNSAKSGQHPLQAERWREDFVNWIAHDNISFGQAASPLPRKVILGGGSHTQHLLPCARTVRS